MPSTDFQKKPPVDIGWIVAGKVSESLEHALETARGRLLAMLNQFFPEFSWKITIKHRYKLVRTGPVQPVRLLESAVRERDANHWDFAIALTSAEMVGAGRRSIFGAISRALDSGVIALKSLESGEDSHEEDSAEAMDILAHRISALAMHYIGHFVGLNHEEDGENFMAEVTQPIGLDAMKRLSDINVESAKRGISIVADKRLEDDEALSRVGSVYFYFRSAAINRSDICDAVMKARPWLFPVHLSRLTTAAISAAMIMIVTEEVWVIAHNTRYTSSVSLSIAVVVATTVYVLTKQRLLLLGEAGRNTEQKVTTNVATAIVVLLGMVTTYIVLFLTTIAFASALFDQKLIDNWVGESDLSLLNHFALLGSFVGSVGLAIGSLGASFESQDFFRHVTYVDEEF